MKQKRVKLTKKQAKFLKTFMIEQTESFETTDEHDTWWDILEKLTKFLGDEK